MENPITNNESNRLHLSGEFGSICFCFTAEALQWLSGTTNDDNNTPIANGILFYDLLRRMRFSTGRDESFRRPQRVSAGAFQFSGIGLAADWNMGRKRVHNLLLAMDRIGLIAVHSSRIASVAAVTCIMGWTDKCGNFSRTLITTRMTLEKGLRKSSTKLHRCIFKPSYIPRTTFVVPPHCLAMGRIEIREWRFARYARV
ncbi:hypothetical protein [uncultured Bacteroides sp.]|uniref:hypothetical protein n=1 Tax=uncultured Bacteroides sp. TaxID=162156 RepID=UPI0026203FE3|nr:hypothetical protein [uncultured Bacteroides sp.]